MTLPNQPGGLEGNDDAIATAGKRPGFRARFHAWWEGYDLPQGEQPEADSQAGATPAKALSAVQAQPQRKGPDPNAGMLDRHGKPLWTATRIDVAEKVWGPGFIGPGAADYVPDLVKPLGLDKTMSVLDLSAGLGGITRFMASHFGAWVTGLELSPVLAKKGAEYSEKEGLLKQAPITHFDPSCLTLDRKFDAVFAKEIFFCLDKEKLLAELKQYLKPGGQLLFTDYLIADSVDLTGLAGWAEAERLTPCPWRPAETATCLKALGYDVRVALDMTDTQLKLIMERLGEFHAFLSDHDVDAETKQAITAEIALWARRAEALRHGLKLYRVHCIV